MTLFPFVSSLSTLTPDTCGRSTTVALAVVVALLILILVVSLLVLYIKHRRIYSAYSQVCVAISSQTRHRYKQSNTRSRLVSHTMTSLFAVEGGQ
jgi:hypothetical protein